MQFKRVSILATDPAALSDCYGRTLGVDSDSVDSAVASVDLGATTLDFEPASEAGAVHLALRTPADSDALTAWLGERATIHSVEGEPSCRFEFLDTDAAMSPTARATSSNVSVTMAMRHGRSMARCR
ncbi:MAG: hypothetical protein J07HN4v3_01100 [Halonotius sp. J07HN4]|nr:MAG: hypothetical protein J07HN4v3_01100 [Halonotius sp. J07HN4]